MIRYYERIGLLLNITRTQSGYRDYSEDNIQTLLFIKRTKELGFSMQEVKELMVLWQNKNRSSAKVKKLTEKHINDLEQKVFKLKEMADFLRNLAQECHGDDRSDCPIIEGLSNNKVSPK